MESWTQHLVRLSTTSHTVPAPQLPEDLSASKLEMSKILSVIRINFSNTN